MREKLLTSRAAEAVFRPYYREDLTIEEAAEQLSTELEDDLPLSLVLLGMGAGPHADAQYLFARDRFEKAGVQRRITLLKKDDKNFLVEASKENQTTSIKASPVSETRSRVVITADAGDSWEGSKELSSRIVMRICDLVQMDCQLVAE